MNNYTLGGRTNNVPPMHYREAPS